MSETKPEPACRAPELEPWVRAAEVEAAAYEDLAAANPDDAVAQAAAAGKLREAERRHIVVEQ